MLTHGDGCLGFEVIDSGSGIPDEELDRVLDRFYRGTHVQGSSSGPGLSIAVRITQWLVLTMALRNDTDGPGLIASVSGLPAADHGA